MKFTRKQHALLHNSFHDMDLTYIEKVDISYFCDFIHVPKIGYVLHYRGFCEVLHESPKLTKRNTAFFYNTTLRY